MSKNRTQTSRSKQTFVPEQHRVRLSICIRLPFFMWVRLLMCLCIWVLEFVHVSSTEKKPIDTRLTKAWTAIDKLLIIWKSDLTDKMKRSYFSAAVVSILLYGCTTWTLTKWLEKKLDSNYTRMLRAILNNSWRQQPHKAPTIRPPVSHHENYPS